jgi:hypothetical protein
MNRSRPAVALGMGKAGWLIVAGLAAAALVAGVLAIGGAVVAVGY